MKDLPVSKGKRCEDKAATECKGKTISQQNMGT